MYMYSGTINLCMLKSMCVHVCVHVHVLMYLYRVVPLTRYNYANRNRRIAVIRDFNSLARSCKLSVKAQVERDPKGDTQ